MKILKFNPKLGFADDLTGASGCANCEHGLHNSKTGYWYHTGDMNQENPQSFPDRATSPHCEGDNEKCQCKSPEPRKHQTIRDKPCKIGDRYAVWEMWRDMKKGLYCPNCLKPWSRTPYICLCSKGFTYFPRKLLEVTISDCVEIEMHWFDGDHSMDRPRLWVRWTKKDKSVVIPYDDNQHPFVKADTPNWTNKQFIDFFLKTYPKIKKEWMKFWIWKW